MSLSKHAIVGVELGRWRKSVAYCTKDAWGGMPPALITERDFRNARYALQNLLWDLAHGEEFYALKPDLAPRRIVATRDKLLRRYRSLRRKLRLNNRWANKYVMLSEQRPMWLNGRCEPTDSPFPSCRGASIEVIAEWADILLTHSTYVFESFPQPDAEEKA